MRIDAGCSKQTESAGLGCILEIVRPAHIIFLQQIQNRSVDGFVAAWRRKRVAGCQMSERSCRQQVRAVRKCRAEHGREVPVVDRKLAGWVVIKGYSYLGTEPQDL